MAKQHDKQFKLDAVQYYQDHKDLGVRGCAENLGIGYSTLTKWLKDFRESGDIPVPLIVKVVVSKNIYFLFVHIIRYCSVPDHHHFE